MCVCVARSSTLGRENRLSDLRGRGRGHGQLQRRRPTTAQRLQHPGCPYNTPLGQRPDAGFWIVIGTNWRPRFGLQFTGWVGKIAELVEFQTPPTDAQRRQWFAYVRGKYGFA